MAIRLPPLNSLRLFEAAGRHLSFRTAADELDVTSSAISHGIQSLEEWLGSPLFARTSRGLILTDAGATYLPTVRDVLTVLASAGEQVHAKHRKPRLTISASPTFAGRLLLPRLSCFAKKHNSLDIDIDTSYRLVEFPRDGFDVAIRLGKGNWAGLAAVPLLTEELVPVCSPELLQKLGSTLTLCSAPLIHLSSVSEDWITWARLTGRVDINCKRGIVVDTIQMSIDAAVEGLGIVLGRRPLVDQELSAGTLVTIGMPSARAEAGYWLVGLPETLARPDIAEFRRWLQHEMSPFEDVLVETCQTLSANRTRIEA
jgi:DNA-binding transcriptional LysR family regulator